MEIMIDIETLGTGVDAVVTQIGVVKFDLNRGEIVSVPRSILLEVPRQLKTGRTVTWETIQFWMRQDAAAQKRALGLDVPEGIGAREILPIGTALQVLSSYWRDDRPEGVWALGPQFDIAILENMYNQYNYPVPWRYNTVADVRTLRRLFPDVDRVEPDIPHDAASDAVAQAKYVIDCFTVLKRLREEKTNPDIRLQHFANVVRGAVATLPEVAVNVPEGHELWTGFSFVDTSSDPRFKLSSITERVGDVSVTRTYTADPCGGDS